MPPVTDDLDVAGADRLVGEPDRAHPRGADLVDRLRRDLLRDPGLDLRLARGDLPLAGLEHLAEDDLLDLLGRRRSERSSAAEIASPPSSTAPFGGERPAHLPERGPGGSEDHGLGHAGFSLDRAARDGQGQWPKDAAMLWTPTHAGRRRRRRSTPRRSPRPRARRRRGAARRASPTLPGAADVKTAFKKLDRSLRPGAPERAARRRARQARGRSTPSACAWPRRWRVKQAGRFDATSIACALPASGPGVEAGGRRGARRGHDPRRLPLRPLPSRDEDDPQPPTLERLACRRRRGDGEASAEAARFAGIAAEAANRARELQNLPAERRHPDLPRRAGREIAAAHEAVSVEVLDRAEIAAELGMGGLVAVSRGSQPSRR